MKRNGTVVAEPAKEQKIKLGWRMVRFDEIAENITDRVDDPSQAGVDRYVGLEHLDPESLKIRRWGAPTDVEATKLRFRPGDIIFGKRRAYQRKLAVADFDGICSAHAMVLRAKPADTVPEFLPFFMQSDVFFERALAISVGSLSPTINWSALSKQSFLIPGVDQQRAITEILSAAEGARVATDNLIHEAISAETIIVNGIASDFAKAPIVPLSKVCDLTVGIVVQPAKYYVADGILALRSLNVFPGRFVLDDVVYISESGHAEHQKSALSEGDVVVVRTGRPGDASVVPSELAGSNAIDLIIVRPRAALVPHFLALFLNSRAGVQQVTRGTAGTAQKHVNVGQLKHVKIPVPSPKEQTEVVNRARATRSAVEQASVHLEDLARLQQAGHSNLRRRSRAPLQMHSQK